MTAVSTRKNSAVRKKRSAGRELLGAVAAEAMKIQSITVRSADGAALSKE
jgi:hypothetical protein